MGQPRLRRGQGDPRTLTLPLQLACGGHGDHRDKDGDEDPGAHAQRLLERAVLRLDRSDAVGGAGQRSDAEHGGADHVEDQRQPGSHQALTGTVVGAGGASAGKHDGESEDESADDGAQPREGAGLQGDDPERIEHGAQDEAGENHPSMVVECPTGITTGASKSVVSRPW